MPEILTLAGNAARERDRLTRNFLIDLRSLTEQLSHMPGRRVLIVASDGFSLQPGRSLFEMISTFTDQAQIYVLRSNFLSIRPNKCHRRG